MERRSLRSPLGRAIGLGSAKTGLDHWWAQRLSAVALVVLGLWLAISIVSLAGADRAAVVAWLRGPLAAIGMILLLVAAFYHAALGLQVVIEDYVHSEGLKLASIAGVQLLSVALAVAGVFAVLRIAFGG